MIPFSFALNMLYSSVIVYFHIDYKFGCIKYCLLSVRNLIYSVSDPIIYLWNSQNRIQNIKNKLVLSSILPFSALKPRKYFSVTPATCCRRKEHGTAWFLAAVPLKWMGHYTFFKRTPSQGTSVGRKQPSVGQYQLSHYSSLPSLIFSFHFSVSLKYFRFLRSILTSLRLFVKLLWSRMVPFQNR